jgi:hypothetical protein
MAVTTATSAGTLACAIRLVARWGTGPCCGAEVLVLGLVWYISQQLHVVSCFLLNIYFQKSFMGEAVFFLLSQRHKLDEAEKK